MRELDPADPPTLCDGKYQLLGILGEGSMGRTYLASTEDRQVAIKALYPSRLATMKDLELFSREADVLQKLDHPRIPSYLDAFDEGEGEAVRYHLVQEFVDGETLRSVIQRGDRYDEAGATRLLRSLVELLQYLHTCDPPVVHRDIKPDNIILRASDGEAVLVDFGAVREVVRLTMGGGSTIIGTYGYMPPEQLMGRAQAASDIYSVGITILEVLTRQTPTDLSGQDALRLIAAANVSDPLKQLLRRMCAATLSDRYADAAQVLADLDATQAGRALVHAKSIEQAIDQREEKERLDLARASAPGFTRVGLYAALAALGAAAVLIVAIVAQFIQSLDLLIVFTGSLTLAALALATWQLVARYQHDAWEAPTETWIKTTGTVTRRELYEGEAVRGHNIHFSFPTGHGKTAEYCYLLLRGNHLPEVNTKFDVYYQPGNPAYWEAQDIMNDADNVMERLFDRSVTHTPE